MNWNKDGSKTNWWVHREEIGDKDTAFIVAIFVEKKETMKREKKSKIKWKF